ncbi:MAG: cobyrinate a,c-diamide synthase [Desulfobacterales bacterium]|jgi:cobyrinic acid a,c-diamide synthase
MKGIVVAGTKSGCGKTTVSLGLMAALVKRGLKVAPFKVGPDFIDPGHHSRIAGVGSRNLDGWMLSRNFNLDVFANGMKDADIAVVEGVMGLFDGYDGKSEAGSTAQIAKWLGLPVILLVDAASMARSAAAIVMGFEHFDAELTYAGVIFNHIGSGRHLQYLKEAVQDRIEMPCLGGILRNTAIAIPERHLGLVTQEDHPLAEKNIDQLADLIEKSIDLDSLLNNLADADLSSQTKERPQNQIEKRVRIAVARDNAFCFYYADNLDLLKQQGAELVFFSPIVEQDLPQDIDGLYLGGGYPELFAEKLAENVALKNRVKKKSADGMPIYGECGGFMYLCEELIDLNNNRYPMSGCFPFTTRMFTRLKALGYREITLSHNTVIGNAGLTIRGHEFHYSELSNLSKDVATVFSITDRSGIDKTPEGYLINHTLGSYNHLHFGSQPDVARCFVENCLTYRNKRN